MHRNRTIFSPTRVPLFIAGIVVLLILFGVWGLHLQRQMSSDKAVYKLSYCGEENNLPCLVSFGVDAHDQMIVSLLVPDNSPANLYLKITHNSRESSYPCYRPDETPRNVYCTGEKMLPGTMISLILVDSDKEIPLAEGNLIITSLLYPTLGGPLPSGTSAPQSPTPRISPTPFPTLPPTSLSPTYTPVPYPNYP